MSCSFPQSHPDRLATVATLLGMDPAPVERCRLLEIGCGMGANLIPMAASLPESTFVGIDLSARQIESAQEIADELRLENLELRQADIADVCGAIGEFDYIICHGVYSWVPNHVQEKILQACAEHLAENGVAYVSYNTYPGWHMRGLIRGIMVYHAQQFTVPKVRIQQSRNLLNFLAKSVAGQSTPYSMLLRNEVETMNRHSDSYLFHEHLEETNEPIYFYQFIERAQREGLKYLGEADLRVMSPGNFPPEVESVLQMLATDIIHLEQYMDFLRNRTFRQTLLCRSSVPVTYTLHPDRLKGMFIASQAKPVSPTPDLQSNEYEKFESGESGISLNHPLSKAAMLCLHEAWPLGIPMTELCAAARRRLNWDSAADARSLASDVAVLGKCFLTAYTSPSARLVEITRAAPRFVTSISEHPRASNCARHQARSGRRVTNQRHESLELDELQRQILLRLDGSYDRDRLLHEINQLWRTGQLTPGDSSATAVAEAGGNTMEVSDLDRKLQELASLAMLVG